MVRGVVKSGGYLLNDEEGCEKGYEKKLEAHLQGLYLELVGIILEVDFGFECWNSHTVTLWSQLRNLSILVSENFP